MSSIIKSQYRPDIDGLRAIAIVSVFLFHINPLWLPGGFLGVDIFFVISGFLITRIIHQQTISGIFSFKTFYTRRIKRLLPVLMFVFFITTILSAFILLPREFINFQESLNACLSLYSNFFFATANSFNYFYRESYEKPLLHIWSLSVEEQFYLIFPIIIFLLSKNLVRNTRPSIYYYGIILLLIISSIWGSFFQFENTKNYFLTHLRANELLIGALIALLPNYTGLKKKNSVGAIKLGGGVKSGFCY